MGLLGVTFIVLLILQLAAVISISWWWVFLPLIIAVILQAVAFIIALVVD